MFSTLPGTPRGIPIECPESNTCNGTFDGSYTSASRDYWLAVEFRGTYHLSYFPDAVFVSNILVTGDSLTRINSNLLKQTFTIGDFRYNRLYFANAVHNISVHVEPLGAFGDTGDELISYLPESL